MRARGNNSTPESGKWRPELLSVLNASAHDLVCLCVFERLLRGYKKMKLSDGVFTVWTTSMLLGVYTWHLGTLWPVLAVMAGWVAPLVYIGDGIKRIQIYQRTLSSISDVIWMSMIDLGLRLCFVS